MENVTPVFKKQSKNKKEKKNRTINILPALSEILENLMSKTGNILTL